MNLKIEKIREAELQIDKLVAQEKKMRRAFLADGTVDAKEQKQLDSVGGKIRTLKAAVAKIRAEIEAARRAWEARSADHSRVKAEMAELAAWGHAGHPKVKSEADRIQPLIDEQSWAEAVKQLDATLKVLNPAVEDFRKQVAAKAAYDPLRQDLDTRLSRASAADPQIPDIAEKVAGLSAQLGAVDTSLSTRDYEAALETVKGTEPELAALEQLVKDTRSQKADYDAEMAELAPRLKEAEGCRFPALDVKHAELGAGKTRIAGDATAHDYVAARSGIAELAVKVAAYMADYAAVVDAKTLYAARLPRIESELATVQQCRFPDLTAQQNAILDLETQMRGAAGVGSYEQALETMDKLDPLVATFRKDEENEHLGQEYAARTAAIAPRMTKVGVCNYTPLEAEQLKITSDHDLAEKAAAAKDYTEGLALLGDVDTALGDFEVRLAAQEKAQTDYEAGLGGITSRFEAISQCQYPQLATQAFDILHLHDRMDAAAKGRDYVAAFAAMTELEREIAIAETTLKALEGKQVEYEMRLPPLVQRFEAAMVSDYAQLEDERASLATGRADMEAAAANRDFPLALDHLNAVERMLNDLDAQAGDLDARKKQYEAVLAKLEPGLKVVENCTHVELTVKKTPIMEMRADMLALAIEEDFGVALARANALIPLTDAFAKLEKLLADYLRRLEVIEPRLEEVKALSYKSLKDGKEKIAKLASDMVAQAAKAELEDALKKMEDLEKQVTAILKLNEELKLKEAVYKDTHGDLAPKVKAIEANKITKKEVAEAAKAVTEAWKSFEKLGGEDEFIKAVDQGKVVKAKIEAFAKAVDTYGDAKEAYEMLRDMARSGYAEAEKKSKEYKDLKDEFEKLAAPRDAMEKAGEGTSPDYEVAKAKANAMLDALKTFDGKWTAMANREATVTAQAEAAYDRFGRLPEDAAKKAGEDYDDAKDRMAELKVALTKKDLERAERLVGELNAALDRVEGAVKTKEQHKADYDGRLASLQPRVDKAGKSPFATKLSEELEAVNDAFGEMTERAEAEDYEGGVKAAPAVESALADFDAVEDGLEQLRAKLDERMEVVRLDMKKLDAIPYEELKDRIGKLRGDFTQVETMIGKLELDEADAPSKTLRDDLRKLLDDAEAMEDAKAKAEKDAEENKGILDKTKDLLEDVADTVVDKVKDEALDYVDTKIKGGKSIIEGIENLKDGEIIDGVKDLVKGVDDLSPIPVRKNVRRAAKAAEEVYDFLKDKL